MRIKPYAIFIVLLSSIWLCQTVSGQVIDRIVAIVNDDIITLVDLNISCTPYYKQLGSGGYSDEQKEKMIKDIQSKVLNQLVDNTLSQQEAKRYSIKVPEREIDSAVENFMKNKSLTRDQLEKALEKEQLTMETYRENIKNQILQSRLINHAVKSKVVITETEVKRYYDENIKAYAGQKKYHLRHILLKDKEQIQAVKEKLDKGDEFAGLAVQYSQSPSAAEGGDLGVFDITGFSSIIKESISKLNEGQYTDVISTDSGFQIFFVEDILMEGYKTIEQARDEIHGLLYRRQVEEKFETWIGSLKKQAHIEIKL